MDLPQLLQSQLPRRTRHTSHTCGIHFVIQPTRPVGIRGLTDGKTRHQIAPGPEARLKRWLIESRDWRVLDYLGRSIRTRRRRWCSSRRLISGFLRTNPHTRCWGEKQREYYGVESCKQRFHGWPTER